METNVQLLVIIIAVFAIAIISLIRIVNFQVLIQEQELVDSVLRCAVTMSPAVENALSAETLVPGIHRYLLANLEIMGYST